MNLSRKLPLAFACISLLTAAAGLFGIYRLDATANGYENLIYYNNGYFLRWASG